MSYWNYKWPEKSHLCMNMYWEGAEQGRRVERGTKKRSAHMQIQTLILNLSLWWVAFIIHDENDNAIVERQSKMFKPEMLRPHHANLYLEGGEGC